MCGYPFIYFFIYILNPSRYWEGKNRFLELSRKKDGIESAMSHTMLIEWNSFSDPPPPPSKNQSASEQFLTKDRFCGIDATGRKLKVKNSRLFIQYAKCRKIFVFEYS
jgi:hypothetical protein